MSRQHNEKNEVGNNGVSTSETSGKEEVQLYIPPGRRERMRSEEKSQRNNPFSKSGSGSGSGSNKFQHYSNSVFQRNSKKKPFSNESNQNGFGRSSQTEHRSKWKSSSQYRSLEYGSDGLLPRNPELEAELFSKTQNTGINFEKYKEIPVEAYGKDVPPCITKFTDLDIGPVLENSINLCNYTVPTPVQQYALPIIFEGRDLMACAQTGSGKTAAFLFPIISMLLKDKEIYRQMLKRKYMNKTAYPDALILVPTRELAIQIFDEARKFTYRSHLRPVVIYGGSSYKQQLYEVKKGCHILVATPGRLLDMIQNEVVSLERVRYLCLDEADRMLDMGFEKDIRHIVEDCGMPDVNNRQTLMFSATFPVNIQKLASDFLKEYIFLKVGKIGSTNDFITQHVKYVEEEDKKKELIKAINEIEGLTLIFVQRKKSATALQDFLYRAGYPTTFIHGDRSQAEREYALESFRKGITPILVATDVAARGLDIFNVAHVINFDMPTDISHYVHRIGRTGRAGNNGIATTFFSENDKNLAKALIETLEESSQEVPAFLSRMHAEMTRFGNKKNRGNGGFFGGYRRNNYNSSTSDYRYEKEHSNRNKESNYSGYGYGGYGNGYGGNYG